MAEQALYEMISAFATGCMDKQNYMQFKDYIEEGGFLPKGELGELQNIISMIPVILELEKPNPSIKDMVAKKLIGMKEEIKTKIIEEKQRTSATMKTATTKLEESAKNKSKSLSFIEKNDSPTTEFQNAEKDVPVPLFTKKVEIEKPTKKSKTPIPTPNESEIVSSGPQSILPQHLSATKRREMNITTVEEKPSSGFVGWIALLLSIVLFSILGYFSYTSLSTLNRTIDDLKEETTSLKTQLTDVNNFINNYTSLVEFFNYKDIQVLSLISEEAAEKGSAQLLLAYNEKDGLIQFKNVKPLQPDKGYQVWVTSKEQPYSLGIYQPNGSGYLKISSFPFLPREKIESYFITVEAISGTQTPSATIYLSSAAGKPAQRGRKE